MKNEFEKWMVKKESKAKATASQYANAIELISRHYSQQTNERIYLYNNPDISFVRKLKHDYGTRGRYKYFGQNGTGNNGHGTVRAAIAAYARFLEYRKEQDGNHSENTEKPNNKNMTNSFIVEGNVKHLMAAKAEELFPGYKIVKKQNEKKDLLVLENINKNELLIIKLKEGFADNNVIPSILEYCGSLPKEFENKSIKGLIIAGEIDESLVKACSTPLMDIGIMKYQVEINLEKIV
jgi:hypothetical protein